MGKRHVVVSYYVKVEDTTRVPWCRKFPFSGPLFQHTHTLAPNLYEDGPQNLDGQMDTSSISCNRILHIVFNLFFQQFFAQYCLTFSMRNPSLYRRRWSGYKDEDDPTKSEASKTTTIQTPPHILEYSPSRNFMKPLPFLSFKRRHTLPI